MIAKTTLKMPTEVVMSDKWTNIFFLKDGRSFVSPYVLPTEEAAKNHADQALKILQPESKHFSHSGISFRGKDYSHAIQVPA